MRNAWRRVTSHVVVALCGAAVLLSLVPLVVNLFYVLQQGLSPITWTFFTQMPCPPVGAGRVTVPISLYGRLAGGLAGNPYRHPGGAETRRRREGAAAFHRAKHLVFQDRPGRADLDADRPGLHVCHGPVRRLAPAGVGGGAGAGDDGADLLGAGAPCDDADGEDATRKLILLATINGFNPAVTEASHA